MFEGFLNKFKADRMNDKGLPSSFGSGFGASGFKEFFELYSGSSFNNGLYRVHSANQVESWNNVLSEAFPEFSKRLCCFGYDWLGRQFALDNGRVENSEPLILMLEPGTGEALEIPVSFIMFHEDELVNYANEALALDFYQAWLSSGNEAPNINQCVGYKKPLFLGGADDISNLELVDLEVYWELSSQLINKVRGLPPGTPINNVSIS